MLHAKILDHRTFGSGGEDFEGLYHIWEWRPFRLCDQDKFNEFMPPLLPKEVPYKIYF